MAYPNLASGPATEGTGQPPQFYAGDTPSPVTSDLPITVAGAALPQYTPLQRNATTGALEAWAAGGVVYAISMYPIPVGTSRAAFLLEGMVNQDAIAWPTGTTEAQILAAMTGDIKYRKLLYSDKRTGTEPTTAGPGSIAGPAV